MRRAVTLSILSRAAMRGCRPPTRVHVDVTGGKADVQTNRQEENRQHHKWVGGQTGGTTDERAGWQPEGETGVRQSAQTDQRASVSSSSQHAGHARARTATYVKRLPQLILPGCQQRRPPPGVRLNAICWSCETTPSPTQNSSVTANCCSAPLACCRHHLRGAEHRTARLEDGEGGKEGEQ